MRHRHLFDLESHAHRLHQDIGIHHGAHGIDLDSAENGAAKQFEGTIDVTHLQPQQEAYKRLPAQRIETTMPGILALCPIADDNVVLFDPGEWQHELTEMKLQIG